MDTKITLTKEEVAEVMPQQFPYLFLENSVIEKDKVVSSYKIRGDEFFLKGHFKNNPVFPASITIEAIGQMGLLYLLKSGDERLTDPVDSSKIFFTSCDGIRCVRICKPNETIDMEIKVVAVRHPLMVFSANAYVNGEKAAHADRICLTFDYKR